MAETLADMCDIIRTEYGYRIELTLSQDCTCVDEVPIDRQREVADFVMRTKLENLILNFDPEVIKKTYEKGFESGQLYLKQQIREELGKLDQKEADDEN